MKKAIVLLNEINKVKDFSREICQIDSDVDFVRGRYVFDAKSMMALFTVDLSEPLEIVLHSDSEDEVTLFCEIMEKYK